MPAGGRTPFTSEDDNLLAKYLATYNPGVQGRSGNKIYQLLVENEHHKWAWSSRHPWAAWRERYTKNQSEFNTRIKKYQLKKGLPTENSHWINGTQKLKGSDVEEESSAEEDAEPEEQGGSKRKRKSASPVETRKRARRDHNEESANGSEQDNDDSATDPDSDAPPAPAPRRPRTHVPDIYPDIAVLEDSSESPTATRPSHRSPAKPAPKPLAANLPKPAPVPAPKPKLKPKPKRPLAHRHDPDSDFFASVPPTPTTAASRPPTTAATASVASSSSSKRANNGGNERGSKSSVIGEPAPAPTPAPKPKSRGLPQLVEGTFRTVFAGVRHWAGASASAAKDDSDGDAMDVEQQGAAAAANAKAKEQEKVKANENEEEELDPPPTRRPLPPRQVNAVASSSRVQLPSSPARRAPSMAEDELEEQQHTRLDDIDQQILALQRQRVQYTHDDEHERSSSSHQRSPIASSPPTPQRSRSPSPLDWGSPVQGQQQQDARSSPTRSFARDNSQTRTPVKTQQNQTPPPIWPSPFPMAMGGVSGSHPFPVVGRRVSDERRRLSFTENGLNGHASGGPSVPGRRDSPQSHNRDGDSRTDTLPRLSFTENVPQGNSHHNRNHNHNRHRSLGSAIASRSVGSVEDSRITHPRRSLAPGPSPRRGMAMDARHYRLPSPPRSRAHPDSSSSHSLSSLGTGTKRRGVPTPTPMPAGFKPLPMPSTSTAHHADAQRRDSERARESEREARRHSLPAALPRVDFDTRTYSYGQTAGTSRGAPRQSLPPRPAPQHSAPLPPRRHGSLFSSRRPPLAPATSALGARRTASASASRPASNFVSPAHALGAEFEFTNIPPLDPGRPLLEQLGHQACALMAANHGFGAAVVQNVFARAGDMRRADEVLRRMREEAERAGEAALVGAVEYAVGEDVEFADAEEGFEPPRRSDAGLGERPRELDREERRRSAPAPAPEEEEPLVLRHRRQPSGATATTARATTRSPPSAPTSSQRKKRVHHHNSTTHSSNSKNATSTKIKSSPDNEFHPQPLARPVLAETEYTPPSGSRAGALARLKKKGRMEEGLQREKERASGGGTISAFERGARRAQALANGQQRRPDMEDDLPAPHPLSTAPFAAFAEGNRQVLQELAQRDVSLAISRTADVAQYMARGTEPSPYR
ncbi:hypothetical protein C8F04DRAFT_707870 [Mycena alexandri]|uniref:TERF2-interacting telomeric protein 1 Myb domain-containing protein n=1 Tax=Mycena alexandri TaxID=1745969 RepID=A0AAD6SNF2_9AGAR|nr:hypothetical protein C8F04DRAFT_707870 [Mycena alexandri]